MRLWTVFLVLALAGGAAFAQKAAPTPAPSPAIVETPPPPYESQMLRLAEILGALATLRDLCGDNDGAAFRAKFAALMEAEANTPGRKSAWAGAFNQAFGDYRASYQSCTPNARQAIAAFLAEGNRIAVEVSDRYSR